MPRVKLLREKSDVPESQHAEIDGITEILHQVGGPFGVMMYCPGLALKVCQAGAHIRLNSTLSPAHRELAILAVSREKDAAFEWAAHITPARNGGVSEEAIEAARNSGDVSNLPDDERDIITFVRQLLQKNKVQQDLFDALVQRHSERWVVELAATIGQYQYISAINLTFELEAKPGSDVLPVTPK